MKNKLLLLLLPVLMNCQSSGNEKKKSDKQDTQFLKDISTNSKVVITDITESRRQPAEDINLVTKYPLSKEKKAEYDKNGTLTNDNDISDSTVYKVKSYDLKNEKNEKVEIVDDGSANNLQKFALSENNKVLYQNVGIEFKLNKKFETLKGFMNIEFEVSKSDKKEVKIPVNVSIQDKVSE